MPQNLPTATAATASNSAMLVRCDTSGCAARGRSSTASLSAWLLGGKASILAVLASMLSSRVLVRYTSSEPSGEAAAHTHHGSECNDYLLRSHQRAVLSL